ncbi:hypothetical protein SY27_11640 [Flavobacterium sp. 316]|uniref:hypothetical protein n=1 Tax=Flavobacterium sp. 316 TaxID=1603293 RepID=UPI0005DDCE4F|nr:hypothetical protein [Flavobacterium sp. 316]KIX20558.1 hypothetical protein SY27_11640 [Flavobacterium sp. 316]
MITKDDVLKIAIQVLKNSDIDYTSIDNVDKIRFISKDDMVYPFPYGKYKGIKKDHFSISYGEIWGIEEKSMFIDIDAENGEPLYIITPHGYLDIED